MDAADRRADWLAERRSGLGGSDIAAALGLSPYKTPYALWLEKTGRDTLTEPDEDARERMHFGVLLEDVVAREFASRTGQAVQRINSQLVHPLHTWARANIDRAIVAPGTRARWDDKAGRVLGASGVLECKTAHAMAFRSAEWGEAGTDQVPQHYYLQCLWYMGLAQLAESRVACLFGGQRFAIYELHFDADLFERVLNEAGEWWRRHVVADTPPPTVTEDETRQRWPRHRDGAARIVGADVAQAVAELAELKRRSAELADAEQALRDRIAAAFEDSESITHAGRTLATWKANRDSRRTDWEAVAALLAPPPELIALHTTTKPGARVLRLNTKE